MALSKAGEDSIANSILLPTALARVERTAETGVEVSLPEIRTGLQPVSEQALRIANRLLSSLKHGEQILACAGVSKDDPSASFAMHVALAFVRLGQSPVIVVDANPERNVRPAQNKPSSPRLINWSAQEGKKAGTIQPSDVEGLDILSCRGGSSLTDPALSSSRPGRLFDELQKYRFLIVDAGPVLESTKSLMIAAKADAVVAVASSGSITKREVARLKAEIATLSTRFLGVVLTDSR